MIPLKLRKQLADDPEYRLCSLCKHGECGGRITWEHAIIYAGKKVQERWAIIPLCEKHHAVNSYQDAGTMNKEMNIWVALNRASDEELTRFSKATNYQAKRDYLNSKYGKFQSPALVF